MLKLIDNQSAFYYEQKFVRNFTNFFLTKVAQMYNNYLILRNNSNNNDINNKSKAAYPTQARTAN